MAKNKWKYYPDGALPAQYRLIGESNSYFNTVNADPERVIDALDSYEARINEQTDEIKTYVDLNASYMELNAALRKRVEYLLDKLIELENGTRKTE